MGNPKITTSTTRRRVIDTTNKGELKRRKRAEKLLNGVRRVSDNRWTVLSSRKSRRYMVATPRQGLSSNHCTCSCLDFKYQKTPCKHVFAVTSFLDRYERPDVVGPPTINPAEEGMLWIESNVHATEVNAAAVDPRIDFAKNGIATVNPEIDLANDVADVESEIYPTDDDGETVEPNVNDATIAMIATNRTPLVDLTLPDTDEEDTEKENIEEEETDGERLEDDYMSIGRRLDRVRESLSTFRRADLNLRQIQMLEGVVADILERVRSQTVLRWSSELVDDEYWDGWDV
ncbi:MAG: hypothetical protein J3Q66DRAFT_96494 [Benniella sp.]|nr:MAG: hypothetical protein J3Q66DRAFT_385982 [Benniella sp.]KAK3824813.1 MAG: hypothetical protein J3Q66DRAFT_96494 [Benniella sp.]